MHFFLSHCQGTGGDQTNAIYLELQQAHQQGPAAAVKAGPVSLPGDARMHFFLSHCQGTGGDQTNAIYLELRQLGFACWYSALFFDLLLLTHTLFLPY